MNYNLFPKEDDMETFIFAEDKREEVCTYDNDVKDEQPDDLMYSHGKIWGICSKYFSEKSNKKKKKKKKSKKNSNYDETPCILPKDMLSFFERQAFCEQTAKDRCNRIPDSIRFDPYHDSAFLFGKTYEGYIGKHQDRDGHISIFGGSGSGKSSAIAIPTIVTWRSPIFAFDFKGELVARARKRKSIILNMLKGDKNFYWYNPFYIMEQDDDENLVQNARELAQAIIPLPHNISEPFWIISARNVLTGAIVYYFNIGAEFIDAMIAIKSTPICRLIETISVDDSAKMCITPDLVQSPKTMVGVSAELHNHIAVFATDSLVQNVLSSSEDASCGNIKWENLENSDIFIRIDQSKIQQWSSILRLMITQLIRTLERRPEKYSFENKNIKSTLLLFDEFPQYGKIDVITSALATLRSKNVTIALFNQSLSDLDAIYGKDIRRVILDNCPFKAILNASDAETQRYFSDLVGTAKVPIKGVSASYDDFGQPLGYSGNISEYREAIIQPHEFASLPNIVLLHPEGFCRVEKLSCYGSHVSAKPSEESMRRLSYDYYAK